jgi:hypothetical protein
MADPKTNTPPKDSAKRRVEDAERLYGSPDRDEVTEANTDFKNKRRKTPKAGDTVRDVNVRKPI